jgi:DNA-binding NtrC family response regulator
MVDGFARYLSHPSIACLARELKDRGLVYQSDEFGTMLRLCFDYAQLHLDGDSAPVPARRRPRPTILIDGETGTGKTELAGLMHALSARRSHPFISATCSQLADEQFLRSVLFGHIKGAYSGATQDRPGLVETAGAGVLLLDDLHKLSDGSSVILHSFLDDGEFSHLGQDEIRRSAHCAMIATVESPRWEEIKVKGDLSESFINRVEQLVVRVPPLASRPADIEHQARHYCQLHAQAVGEEMDLSESAVAWLVDYGFPGGNSRRLRDFLKGVVSHCARVTDYIDLPEIEEFARQSRFLSRPDSAGKVVVSAKSAPPVDVPSPSAGWSALADGAGWPGRIARLAVAAVADELELDALSAENLTKDLFEGEMPRLWKAFEALVQRAGRPVEIKLFDELLRYFVVFQTGNPAKAAKQLGMKDNALREFIYSREQKREANGREGE